MALQHKEEVIRDTMLWTFEYHYHRDKANASMHCDQVKFSPITLRLYHALKEIWPKGDDWTMEMAEVRHQEHLNQMLLTKLEDEN